MEATITSPATVPAGLAMVMLDLESGDPFEEAARNVTGPDEGGGGGGGGETAGAPWQEAVPESVNVLPASGTNSQS
jgi:hypothetical protein